MLIFFTSQVGFEPTFVKGASAGLSFPFHYFLATRYAGCALLQEGCPLYLTVTYVLKYILSIYGIEPSRRPWLSTAECCLQGLEPLSSLSPSVLKKSAITQIPMLNIIGCLRYLEGCRPRPFHILY